MLGVTSVDGCKALARISWRTRYVSINPWLSSKLLADLHGHRGKPLSFVWGHFRHFGKPWRGQCARSILAAMTRLSLLLYNRMDVSLWPPSPQALVEQAVVYDWRSAWRYEKGWSPTRYLMAQKRSIDPTLQLHPIPKNREPMCDSKTLPEQISPL